MAACVAVIFIAETFPSYGCAGGLFSQLVGAVCVVSSLGDVKNKAAPGPVWLRGEGVSLRTEGSRFGPAKGACLGCSSAPGRGRARAGGGPSLCPSRGCLSLCPPALSEEQWGRYSRVRIVKDNNNNNKAAINIHTAGPYLRCV